MTHISCTTPLGQPCLKTFHLTSPNTSQQALHLSVYQPVSLSPLSPSLSSEFFSSFTRASLFSRIKILKFFASTYSDVFFNDHTRVRENLSPLRILSRNSWTTEPSCRKTSCNKPFPNKPNHNIIITKCNAQLLKFLVNLIHST